MSILTKPISFKRRLFSSSGWAFLTMMVWECVESLLEYAIAYVISSAITMLVIKFVATLLIITTTQIASKHIQRFLMTFIKKLTYKEGEDKVNAIKKFFGMIFANKCSIVTILTAITISLSGTQVIDVNDLPAINITTEEAIVEVVVEEDVLATEIVYAEDGETIIYNVGDVITPAGTILVEGKEAELFNLTPIIYYALLGLILVIFGIFPETKEAFEKRVAEQKVVKEQKALEKIALAEIKDEEKKANQTQAEQEKAKAKAEAERIANEEKERLEKAKRAKIEEIKAKFISSKNK